MPFVADLVRPGLVPGIHVLSSLKQERRGWPGRSPAMTERKISRRTLLEFTAVHLDAAVLVAMFTTCTRRLTSAIGLAGSLSLLLPYPTVTRSGPAMPNLSTR